MRRAGAAWRGYHSLVLGMVALAAWSGSAIAQSLNETVRILIENSPLSSATVGVSIVDVASGRVLAGLDDARPMIPASNMKVLTVGGAMSTLGTEHAFRTKLLIEGDRLIVRGSGDPAFGDREVLSAMQPPMSAHALVERLAETVVGSGVGPLREIVVDDRVFDRQFVHPDWPVDQLNRRYCAEVAGLNFHANLLAVYVTPPSGAAGTTPSIQHEPDGSWFTIESRAKSARKGANTLWLARSAQQPDRFTLFGQVTGPTLQPVEVTTHDNPRLFGRLLAERLEDMGVTVGTVRTAEAHERFERARPVVVVTTPMQDVARRCMVDSQNLYAEALLKALGHAVTGLPGSWENGSAVLRMTITEALGPQHGASTVVADGSGLSDQNRIAPATLTAWLAHAATSDTLGEPYISTFPTVGEGTLRNRFTTTRLDHHLRAKSGYINRNPGEASVCLSGYVIDLERRHKVAFAILVNDLQSGRPVRHAKKLHEQIVDEIDAWLSIQAKLMVEVDDSVGQDLGG